MTNRLVVAAVLVQLVLLAVFLGFAPLAGLLGGSWPTSTGWLAAAAAPVALVAVDGLVKEARRRRRPRAASPWTSDRATGRGVAAP